MKVLNFGSLNIDYVYKLDHIVEKGETISSDCLQVYPGGKGLNQSVALGKAGAMVYHAGAIGEEGQFLLECLKDANVNIDFVKIISEEKSGHAIIQNDKDGENCILLFGGANQAITKEQIDETLTHFEKEDYLVLQNEINELFYLVEKAYEKGMKIVLNPSPLNEKILALPLEKIDYFLLNEIEGRQILNTNTDDGEQLLEQLCKKFPNAHIVLTLGKDGSKYANRKERISQGIYKVKAVDTTAAGDTFSGYFIASILEGKEVKEALDIAAKASAIAVSRNGAGVSIPTKEEVAQFQG